MTWLKQLCEDINKKQTEAYLDFVFVDDKEFENYQPKSFKSLLQGFQEYKQKNWVISKGTLDD